MHNGQKVAIITGSGQGIGKAIAERFSAEGLAVIIADNNAETGNHVAHEITKKGGSARFVHCDVADELNVSNLIAETMNFFGAIDILVNNAATAVYKTVEDITLTEWDKVLAVNLRSMYLTTRYCFPKMKLRGGGSIISLSSIHAHTTSTNNSPYAASKGAVSSLVRALALEGASYHIRVNSISPGAIATPMLLENWGTIDPDTHPFVQRIPLKRFGRPEEIASIAYFLSTDASSYMTGSDLIVDGGLSIHFN